MKVSRDSIGRKQTSIPEARFENRQMTSFGGLVVFQSLFATLGVYDRPRDCCRHLKGGFYRHDIALRCLVIHMLLGFRRLREIDHYREDPMVLRAATSRCG